MFAVWEPVDHQLADERDNQVGKKNNIMPTTSRLAHIHVGNRVHFAFICQYDRGIGIV